MLRAWPVAVLLLLAVSRPATAEDGCVFQITNEHTWTLDADCTVDSPIVIPDGYTLDGAQHTITAIDPAGGYFRGGIIVNGGRTAAVTNTIITAVRLANVCQEGNDRLRAIHFTDASGVIRGNAILNVNKGASSCQEGNGIEVRHADASGPPAAIEIADNLIDGFQKTGIVASGNVDVEIHGNTVGPSSTQRFMVTNGIQVSAGARVAIEFNTVTGNSWAGDAAAATAILLMNTAPGALVRGNVIVGNADVGIYVMANEVRVERNRLTDSGPDGAFDVGIGNYGEGNVFDGNTITGYSQRYQNVPEPRPDSNSTIAAR